MRRLTPLLASLLLAACAGAPARPAPAPADLPMLRLAPSALPGGLASQQRLQFEHGERRDSVDALVEVDADVVRVVLHQQGQVVLRLDWDGRMLREQRGPGAPETLVAARVLSDLQLVHWPVPAIRAALPPGWRLQAAPARRELWQGDACVATVEFPATGEARLHNLRLDYRLVVRSATVQP